MSVPYYAIAASVPPGNRVMHFRGDSVDSPTYWLADIKRFRRSGFDVSIPGPVVPGEADDTLELTWYDRKLLRLYQDGTLLFRARADNEFLGWAEPAYFAHSPHLNPVAVVEVQASFVALYRSVCERLKRLDEVVQFRLQLNPGDYGGSLAMTRYHARGHHVDPFTLPTWTLQEVPAEASFQVAMAELREHPMGVAYQALVAFSSWFDVPKSELDFVHDTPHGREIDLERIRSL